MGKADVSRFSPLDMIAYLTDCTLATVVDMSMKKRVPKYEYERQIAIAQQGMDFLRYASWSPKGGDYKYRPHEIVLNYDWSVAHYAAEIRERYEASHE